MFFFTFQFNLQKVHVAFILKRVPAAVKLDEQMGFVLNYWAHLVTISPACQNSKWCCCLFSLSCLSFLSLLDLEATLSYLGCITSCWRFRRMSIMRLISYKMTALFVWPPTLSQMYKGEVSVNDKSYSIKKSLPPSTKFGQGNIFSSVCQEFCSRGGIPACLAGHMTNQQYISSCTPGRQTPWADTPQVDTPQQRWSMSGRYASYWNALLLEFH